MTERMIAGKYLLKREIGRGGMGVVWEAVDQVLQRRVALKLISSDQAISDVDRLRLEHEAKAIAKLQNNHVVQVHDFGIENGVPYLVMEYLDGETLAERLMREGKLPLAAVQVLLQQVALGLEAANAAGIVHQDLKPANIFIARQNNGATEYAKLLDFGLVWRPDEGRREHRHKIVGTPVYMSPEQVNGYPADHSNDLWGLSVILYRALTGTLPFTSELGMWSVLAAICLDPHVAPSTIVPELPPGLDEFFNRALAKDRSKRYPNVRALCSAFVKHSNTNRAPIKILAVDDEPDVEKLLRLHFRRQIRSATYEFHFATDGAKALEVLQQNPDIDVVLSDINMPVMNGLALLERVSEARLDCRVVMVSAFGDMKNIRTAMNRGAFDFVLKPIDFDDLAATIEKTSKHINELRKNVKTTKEYDVLKTFTNPSLLEHIRTVDATFVVSAESARATALVLNVCRGQLPNEPMRPSDVVRRLNTNFETMTATIVQHGGIVDKFVSSSVVAVFRDEGCTNAAVMTAMAIRNQMESLAREFGPDSPYASGVGIGIAEGEVLSGALGSHGHGRFDYGSFGSTVDTALQLAYAAEACEILLDETACINLDPAFTFEQVDPVRRLRASLVTSIVRLAGSMAVNSTSNGVDSLVTVHDVPGI